MKFKLPRVNFELPDAAFDPEPPPILGSWRNLYVTAIAWLFLLIAIFYAFTRYFA